MTTFIDVAYARLRYLLTDRYGNELSEDHELVLKEGLIALADSMLTGSVNGRIAVGLPCGMGKTTAIRAIIWALNKLDMETTVTVACYRVEQLCGMVRQLSLPDSLEADGDGIDRNKLGLVHSYDYDEKRAGEFVQKGIELPPGKASEPSGGANRQFLFVSHERVKAGEEMPAWLQRDLTFYDESLIVSEARVFTLLSEVTDGLFNEINKIRDLAEQVNNELYGDAARWLMNTKQQLIQAMKAIGDCAGVHTLPMPPLTAPVVKKLRELLPEYRWPYINRLMDYANEELRNAVVLACLRSNVECAD